jgi:hypothetical protein
VLWTIPLAQHYCCLTISGKSQDLDPPFFHQKRAIKLRFITGT